MASLILSSAGNALFGPVGGFIGALAGSAIDNAAITALTPARVQPSRLAGLKVQASQEGSPIPIVYGRFRVAGQVIWASKFDEVNIKRTVGGKGGQRVVERSYTISFAIGLCEGAIDGLGRVWINGDPLDLSTIAHRLYLGGATQMPDPLIEALEGLSNAPAFRGLAYIVFEDFAVSAYGDRIPQFAFEVMASPHHSSTELKQLARGVCLIPGAGEFAYATTPIRKILGAGDEIGENLHAQIERSDLDVSLDNLARDLPNAANVSLVVAWFGTDLRAGQCLIVPKVEDATKQTSPRAWRVAGLDRTSAQVVSQSGGKPAYGGSPDDQSVIEAIIALKVRGHRVTHNPFIMMDIAASNTLPNPLGGATQPPYAWRGRITCFPGIGQAGSADNTASASTQIANFFGTANASHFSVSGTNVTYFGPSEWTYRRFVLHQAALTVAAGGVDTFLIGSELIGLTRVRGLAGDFPAVTALIALAAEVRALVGPTVKISYGADWTEYGGYSPAGTSDLRFPLDRLWADANIDFIGLDWYAPLTDRRDGEPRANLEAMQAGIEGGEGYDFYYANDAARQNKSRTPITDPTYQEPWVWRQKDVRGFWSNTHYERTAGVKSATPTAWLAKSKPLALMELGFPAVDKGANRPSVFPDPKSSEAGLPPFSSGARDDIEQRLGLEATLSYWRDNNDPSNIYAGDLMDMSRCHLWAWDARPFPYFPGLTETWADGTYAMLGHWLAGRAGAVSLAALIADICRLGGLLDVNVDGIAGYVDGFAIEAVTSARSVLENLFAVFGLEALSQLTGLAIRTAVPAIAQLTLSDANILAPESGLALARTNQVFGGPSRGQFSCYAAERDYLPATHMTPATGQVGPVNALASSLVLDPAARRDVATRLAHANTGDGISLSLSPATSIRLEAGDRFALADGAVWRADRCEGQWSKTISASRAPDHMAQEFVYAPVLMPAPPAMISPPIMIMLDITAPFTSSTTPKPIVGCTSAVWPGDIDVSVEGQPLATLTQPMTYGSLAEPIALGSVGRLMSKPLLLRVKFGALLPASGRAALLQDGATADIISWQNATLTGQGLWQLDGWVRGLNGVSEAPALPFGSAFVLLNEALVEVNLDPNLTGVRLTWQARPLINANVVTSQSHTFAGIALQPWPPCGLRAKRTTAGIVLHWTRRARGTGDAWATANAPLGAGLERYEVAVLTSTGTVVRMLPVTSPSCLYPDIQELADFGSLQSQMRVTITQIGDDDLHGVPLAAIVAV